MGLFSSLFGKKTPEISIPEPPKLPSAQELFDQASQYAKTNFPMAFGAREGALSNISTPEAALSFFSGFQPTSFEQALGAQNFANIMPDVERSIKHSLSLSGLSSSPILAEQIGKARGNLGVDIGEILTNLANQRAMTSLNSRLGIDPYSQLLNPFVNTGVQQSTNQADMLNQYNMLKSQADFQNSLNKANRFNQMIDAGAGLTLGAITGGFTGGLPGGLSGLEGFNLGAAGGGFPGIEFSDALSFASPNLFKGQGKTMTADSVKSLPVSRLQTQPVFSLPNYYSPYSNN